MLCRFQGRSSLKTFLVAVITHLYLDWRNARWGKWRPSAVARRRGPVGILLEQLLVRDRLTFEEAYETLRTNYNIYESRQVLEGMAARFPVRSGRLFVSEEVLDAVPAVDARTDGPLTRAEAVDAAQSVRSIVAAAMRTLPPQDRLILQMRFYDGFGVADVARALQLEPKSLYRRIDRLLHSLRSTLERHGVSAQEATELLGQGAFESVETPADGEAERMLSERRDAEAEAPRRLHGD